MVMSYIVSSSFGYSWGIAGSVISFGAPFFLVFSLVGERDGSDVLILDGVSLAAACAAMTRSPSAHIHLKK